MNNTINNLFYFIKYPDFQKLPHSWSKFFTVLLINFMILILIWFVDLTFLNGTELLEIKLFTNFRNQFLFIFLIGTTVIPVYEEYLFRIYLTTTRHYVFPILIMVIYVMFSILGNLVETIIYFLYLIFLLFLYQRPNRISNNPGIAIYGSAVFFALFHIFNYEFNILFDSNIFLIAFTLFPQFIGGFLASFIRIRFGFWYAVLYHCICNLILMLIFCFLINSLSLFF